MRSMAKGLFITFEGPEGGGKSTHLRLLASYLKKQGHSVLVTREPGGTQPAFRRLLLDSREGLSPVAELFLYEADRAQHVAETLRPALAKGQVVLCDRYTDSTLAYQGDGRGLSRAMIAQLNEAASGGLVPDLTILLDVPVARGLRQAHASKKSHDRLERAGLAFHKRVRQGFLRLAQENPGRFRLVAQQPAREETQRRIREAVDRFLQNPRASSARPSALPPEEEVWARGLERTPQL
jgi:dTMP kinase